MDAESAGLRERLEATLGGTHTLERELGGGGMSRVFVAHDARLGRRVVVKVLHPDLVAGLSARRFEREVALAARLQHPHVVPLLSAGDVGGLPYYTMPYLEGESLRARLEREGAQPVPDVVRLLRELADALAYAHAQGVIHRDLKPENVLLSGGHAVIADFGVAKALASATQGAPVGGVTGTAVDLAVGTPAYMSPEQVAADPAVDARADLYALGIVAYELLAGVHPFAGRSPQAMLAAQLTETPAPLAERRPEVPPALAALVTRLLGKRPEVRVQSASEVVRALEALATPPAGTAVTSRAARRRPIRTVAVTLAIATVVISGWWAIARARRPAPNGGAAPPGGARGGFVERRVAVAPFENQTRDSTLAPLGFLTSDWITQGLAEAAFAEVVDPETIRSAWRVTPNARALAATTRARIIVSGTYYREGDTLRLLARVSDAAEDKLLRALSPVSAPARDPQQAIAVLRDRVLGALGGLLDVRAGTWAAASGLPPSLAAYQHWSAGLEHYFADDHRKAIPEFAEAWRLDSTYILPLLWASTSYKELGEFAAADSLLRVVDRQPRERLKPADRYLLENVHAQLRGDWAGALRAAREMARVEPAAPTAAIVLAWHAVRVNRPREAVAALTRFDPERPPLRQLPWYWSMLASAHHLLGDHQTELAVSTRGRGLHPDQLAPLGAEAVALAALGRADEAQRRLDEAMDVPAGGTVAARGLMRTVGAEFRAHGHEEAAQRAFAQALAWYDGRPPDERSRAAVLYQAGRWDEARALFERLAAEQPHDPDPRGYLGALAARRGDRNAALAADSALAALREPYLLGQHTYWRARIAALLGDRERALALLREALQQGRTYLEVHAEGDFASLRTLPAFQELVRPKG